MDKESAGMKLIRLMNLHWLIPMAFTYALGVSLVHHLGGDLSVIDIVFGFIVCCFIFIMRSILNAYFDHPESLQSTLNKADPAWTVLTSVKRGLLLQTSLLVLTAGAVLTVILITRKTLTIPGLTFLGLALLGLFFSATPPLRLDRSGFGDIIEGIVVVNLVPAIAMSLQSMDVPFLLLQITLILLLIYLATRIALSIRQYGADTIYERHSLVTRMGWQNAIVLHNVFILSAFVLVGVFMLAGMPWSISWPTLLALPVGLWQIWQMARIAEGDKPRWRLLLTTAMGLFLLMVYLVIVALWT